MNCKLEKFWNIDYVEIDEKAVRWTVNLKSFEISYFVGNWGGFTIWTVNLKSFEIKKTHLLKQILLLWTVNLKSFEIGIEIIFFNL